MLDHRRKLTLPRFTAAPTATQLRVFCNTPLSVAAGQPLLLLDDLFVWSRPGAARRLIPAEQLRVSNDSFAQRSPVTGNHYTWMEDDPQHSLQLSADSKSLEMGILINWGSRVPPNHDADAATFKCTGELLGSAGGHSAAGSEGVAWTCRQRNDTQSTHYTCEIDAGSGKKTCRIAPGGTLSKASCESTCGKDEERDEERAAAIAIAIAASAPPASSWPVQQAIPRLVLYGARS